ncbi:hypothetical protein HF086_013539 [Spodoptera exigua]|uniref:Helicase ATP-binding domain-containing protein n=1 Tax=Spodoptera exigua TaxID=7107 RepID=A0A922SN15_SPOEX|nr:hypothetical protein HF086_013539 [Spodoptera exigua]
MESSFFEYRNETAADSGSESEFIDDSLVDESFGVKKKNHTVFVAESEESTTDEAVSPEIVPKRRPLMRKSSASNNDSIIGRKTKKRMMLIDSDTENSIIIEHDKHKKLLCTKDTPLKIDSGKNHKINDQSMVEDNLLKNESQIVTDSDDEEVVQNASRNVDKTKSLVYGGSDDSDKGTDEEYEESDDDGPDEDQMVMSRATRMSIMGVVPKGNDSDESDFIQSDDSHRNSNLGSVASLTDLPELEIPPKTPEKTTEDQDSSKITCSPFSSPLQDITNESINARKSLENKDECVILSDGEKNASSSLRNKVLNNLIVNKAKENFIRYDDDVTIIDTKPEIIALSSDDEDEPKAEEKSPKERKSPRPKQVEMSQNTKTITKYLMPPSYPSQQVVYVKKHIREAELMKLESLKEDLKNVKYLLEEMDVNTLPDGGGKLIERMTSLEEQFRRQGEKVANMVVEQDNPSAVDVDKKGLSWDELQKASNAVMPRMFGKQAMATHMAERNLILDRLRDLYESLASRPAESQLAAPPRALRSTLMPHQLHALAWLRWRETQRPRAGILGGAMNKTVLSVICRLNLKRFGKGVLMRVYWRRVILDEAHVVRNHKSATCGAAGALRAPRRWCLTGTPVQNKDLDLFALLKFLRCSPFDDLTVSLHTILHIHIIKINNATNLF